MCGIFGIVETNPSKTNEDLTGILQGLMEYSQNRGRDATGLATWTKGKIHVLKRPVSAMKLSRLPEFETFVKDHLRSPDPENCFFLLGHCRLMTDGDSDLHQNNQPVIDEGMVVAHNGIVVNADQIYQEDKELRRDFDVDSEIFPDLISKHLKLGSNLETSLSKTFQTIKGSASIALFPPGHPSLVLATNNGSLFFRVRQQEQNFSMVFASERYALEQLGLDDSWEEAKQLTPAHALLIEKKDGWKRVLFSLDKSDFIETDSQKNKPSSFPIEDITQGLQKMPPRVPLSANPDLLKFNEAETRALKRCTKCILPATFPFIHFDKEGVCNICRTYSPIQLKGEKALLENLNYGSNPPKKIILALSGGRDSCYALHYLRKTLDLPVVAYTYDWGAVTGLARRNMSLMCGELGVEHVLVSADINKKRENIRKNVLAWLKRPRLGTVPLFMAGDKQFFYYAQVVKKQNKADHLIFGMNPLEKTDFKVGFCGIKTEDRDRHYQLGLKNQARMISWYMNEFLRNPDYINSSIVDTAFGFFSYYLANHDYNILYQYLPWEEDQIVNTLIQEYDWEVATDTTTTWRIGDGTASFYNYIYYTAVGFTESDTFRSNQVREGQITRQQAMDLMIVENRPRFESIKWYCDTMKLDFNDTISQINKNENWT